MSEISKKLAAAGKRALLAAKKSVGFLVAVVVLALLVISSVLVVLRMDTRPRTDDAFLLAYVASIAPDVSGRIVGLNIVNNQTVRAGDVLFNIDPEPFQFKLDALKAQHKLASITLDRMEPLLGKGYVTAEQIDEAYSTKDSTEALANLSAWDLDKTTVKAPFDGKIVGLNYAVGQYATAGKPVFTMIDTSRWYAVANFRETEIAQMKQGALATIYVMSHPEQALQGRVESIGWGVTTEDATLDTGLPSITKTLNWVRLAQRFPVRILLDNPPDDLMRIGATVVVVVHSEPSGMVHSFLHSLGWTSDAAATIPAN